MSKIVVLGVDPGIQNTGFSIISRSTEYRLLESRLVRSSPKTPQSERLLAIYESAFALLRDFDCDLVAIEKCFHNKNVSSSQSTGAVIGSVMCAAAGKGVRVIEITPQQVKASTGMGGRCDKKMVVKMVSRLLKQKTLNNHVADAAACAIAGCLAA